MTDKFLLTPEMKNDIMQEQIKNGCNGECATGECVCESDKMREKLIDEIGLHTGWEESAVILVDKCIMPAINKQRQEIQRLREALNKIKDVTDGNVCRGEDYFDDIDFIGEIVDKALQETTTKE